MKFFCNMYPLLGSIGTFQDVNSKYPLPPASAWVQVWSRSCVNPAPFAWFLNIISTRALQLQEAEFILGWHMWHTMKIPTLSALRSPYFSTKIIQWKSLITTTWLESPAPPTRSWVLFTTKVQTWWSGKHYFIENNSVLNEVLEMSRHHLELFCRQPHLQIVVFCLIRLCWL